jgi:phosphonate transport system permease protein
MNRKPVDRKPMDRKPMDSRQNFPASWGWLGCGCFGLLLVLVPIVTGPCDIVNLQGWPQLWRFVVAAFHPNLSSELFQITGDATIVTLAYTACGTVLTVLLGLVLGSLSAEVGWIAIVGRRAPWLYFPLRMLLAVPRSLHELIWGLFLVNIWGLDPLTAIVAIAIPFGAMTAKVFAEILDDTPRQPLAALLNSGVPPMMALCYGLYPQALPNLLSYAFYRFECALRSATVLGIIGAGGLGYQIFVSLQSLKYEELWTFFYALMILNGLVDWGSAWLRKVNFSRSAQWRSVQWRSPLLLLLGMIVTIAALGYLHPTYSKLASPRSQQLFGQFVTSLMPPDWAIGPQLVQPMIDTVAMSVLAVGLAAGGGLLLAFPAAPNLLLSDRGRANRWGAIMVGAIARLLLLGCRAIPAPIWALVILYVMFPGILPGAIALGLHNLGILGRLMTEVIENLDRRPLAALKTTGARNWGILLYGVLPLTMPRFVAYSLYRWEVCMRETVIVGLVGAGGLGRLLTEQLSSFDHRAVVVTLTAFLGLTLGADWLSGRLRSQLR